MNCILRFIFYCILLSAFVGLYNEGNESWSAIKGREFLDWPHHKCLLKDSALQLLSWQTTELGTIQINHQPFATIFQFIILTFIYSSTCFGRFLAHHQGLNDCSSSPWFYLRIVVTVVLRLWSGRPTGRPDHKHSTTVTTMRRQNQRLPLQSLSFWWRAEKRPKHVEL